MILDVVFDQLPECLSVDIIDGNMSFPVDFREANAVSSNELYTGSYEVIPSNAESTLQTAKKLMKNDVTVRAIPYFCISNPSGGNTVYIGGEIEIS